MMLERVWQSCSEFARNEAFFIGGRSFTYAELGEAVAAVRDLIDARCEGEQTIGILAYDDLETYASIFATWFSGRTMVPLNLASPPDRNANILAQAGARTVLGSTAEGGFAGLEGRADARFLLTSGLPRGGELLPPRPARDEDIAYILFTSGSTGVPKGVPIGHGALRAFFDAYAALGLTFSPSDRVLQMFNLTFDPSLASYCPPLMAGASVVTVPLSGIKYMEVYRLLEEQEITVALLVPSILAHLRPYLPEIHLPKLSASLFCGEALYDDLLREWASSSAPNARFWNVYGPTECTIVCIGYEWARDRANKAHNGIVSIGLPMKHTAVLVVDEALRPVAPGVKGELCLSGAQLTPGYWNNPEKNREAFFDHEGTRFYRTGDLCLADADGDVMYAGRLDHQVKIQGLRVELSEIEHYARAFTGIRHVAAVACPDGSGNTAVHLYLEGFTGDIPAMLEQLRTKLPSYMIPFRTTSLDALPLNANGKIDRPALVRRGL